MRNGNKSYKAQGLVVDVQGGQRLVLCQTGYNLYRWIHISNNRYFGVIANRVNDEEKYLDNHMITKSEIILWLSKSGSQWMPKRIMAPKKIRIVCS